MTDFQVSLIMNNIQHHALLSFRRRMRRNLSLSEKISQSCLLRNDSTFQSVIANEVKQSVLHLAVLPNNNVFSMYHFTNKSILLLSMKISPYLVLFSIPHAPNSKFIIYSNHIVFRFFASFFFPFPAANN